MSKNEKKSIANTDIYQHDFIPLLRKQVSEPTGTDGFKSHVRNKSEAASQSPCGLRTDVIVENLNWVKDPNLEQTFQEDSEKPDFLSPQARRITKHSSLSSFRPEDSEIEVRTHSSSNTDSPISENGEVNTNRNII